MKSTPKTVLVTGAFGNIGTRVALHLLQAGHRVVATDLRNKKTEAAASTFGDRITIVWGDICDPAHWHRALAGVDAVVHMAAIIPPVTDRLPALAVAVNQTATLELIKQMENSPSARRLVFASSMVVAGHEQHLRNPPLRVDEEPKATDIYGKTKIAAEQRLQDSSLHWSILRIAVCPPSDLSFGDASNFEAIFDTSPTGRVEVVHNDDAALAFANAVDCDSAIGKILFVGGGEKCRVTTLEFYNKVFTAMGLGPIVTSQVLRPGPAYFFGDWLDTAESQSLLRFQRHSLDDILEELKKNVGWKRALLWMGRPVVRQMLRKGSPHLQQAKTAG